MTQFHSTDYSTVQYQIQTDSVQFHSFSTVQFQTDFRQYSSQFRQMMMVQTDDDDDSVRFGDGSVGSGVGSTGLLFRRSGHRVTGFDDRVTVTVTVTVQVGGCQGVGRFRRTVGLAALASAFRLASSAFTFVSFNRSPSSGARPSSTDDTVQYSTDYRFQYR